MRDEGIEFKDPVVDSDGNVQRPELVEGVTYTRAELAEPYEACAHHLEGLTFGREREDMTERVDQFVALATCLREKGYDVDDPTAETIDQWGVDFRAEFDWDDPDAKAAYEECSSAGLLYSHSNDANNKDHHQNDICYNPFYIFVFHCFASLISRSLGICMVNAPTPSPFHAKS
jgi:hypothetical protein